MFFEEFRMFDGYFGVVKGGFGAVFWFFGVLFLRSFFGVFEGFVLLLGFIAVFGFLFDVFRSLCCL